MGYISQGTPVEPPPIVDCINLKKEGKYSEAVSCCFDKYKNDPDGKSLCVETVKPKFTTTEKVVQTVKNTISATVKDPIGIWYVSLPALGVVGYLTYRLIKK